MIFKVEENKYDLIDKYVINGSENDIKNTKNINVKYNDIKSLLKNGENTIVVYDADGNMAEFKFTMKVPSKLTATKPLMTQTPITDESNVNDEENVNEVVINDKKDDTILEETVLEENKANQEEKTVPTEVVEKDNEVIVPSNPIVEEKTEPELTESQVEEKSTEQAVTEEVPAEQTVSE